MSKGAEKACDQAQCQTCSGNAQRSEASSTMRGQAVRNGASWLFFSFSIPGGSHCLPGLPAATGVVRTFQSHFGFTENKLRIREDVCLGQSHTVPWKRGASQKAAGGCSLLLHSYQGKHVFHCIFNLRPFFLLLWVLGQDCDTVRNSEQN